jgi:LysB family phage lysis regulatory protein
MNWQLKLAEWAAVAIVIGVMAGGIFAYRDKANSYKQQFEAEQANNKALLVNNATLQGQVEQLQNINKQLQSQQEQLQSNIEDIQSRIAANNRKLDNVFKSNKAWSDSPVPADVISMFNRPARTGSSKADSSSAVSAHN